ncbi:ABC transporter permease [Actinomadura roseirufa]|uniref:ABC transporter permease n=1 Tax=Actinomadura roseirufa TaxID=2094049 RepID=UPI0010417E2F|nr:ABC transporter permease [Actinomadura roseirufa]
MIWLTLRQFRVQAAIMGGALVALAALLALTGPGMADDYDRGIAACEAGGDCAVFTRQFFDDHQALYQTLVAALMCLPGAIGLFWGAPLITRELETGTHRLVWNQTITRTRWLVVKLGLVGLTATVSGALAGLMLSWWAGPLEKAGAEQFPRMTPLMFDSRGIVPLGYAMFGFVLGVTAGVLLRRTLTAMAVTLAVFVAVQLAVPAWIRPYYIPAKVTVTKMTSENIEGLMFTDRREVKVRLKQEPGIWELSSRTIDSSGRAVSSLPSSLATGACAPPTRAGNAANAKERCFSEITRLGYRQKLTFQPAGRFWPFQWIETGLFLVLSAALTAFCFYWTRRRVS